MKAKHIYFGPRKLECIRIHSYNIVTVNYFQQDMMQTDTNHETQRESAAPFSRFHKETTQ